MNNILLEVFKFIYSVIVAVAAIVIFALVLDVICYLVSGGWTDYTGYARAGTWPIFKGTTSRVFLTPFIFIFFLLLGAGGIVRMMIGESVPFVFSKWVKKEEHIQGQ